MLSERGGREATRIRRFDDAYTKGVAWTALVLLAAFVAAALVLG